jgi:hypothetical protein
MGPIIAQIGGARFSVPVSVFSPTFPRHRTVKRCYKPVGYPRFPSPRHHRPLMPPALRFAVIQIREPTSNPVRNRPTRCVQKISSEFQEFLTTIDRKKV